MISCKSGELRRQKRAPGGDAAGRICMSCVVDGYCGVDWVRTVPTSMSALSVPISISCGGLPPT